jgi:tripartite-type tricarboxylate transporter receptor subunit TctC
MTTAYPYILVVNAKLPARSLPEFVALAKSQPGAMNYGTTGIGAANHLVAELFNGKAGLKMTHIPYRGTALAVGDLVAGQVTMVFGDPISVLPHMQSGSLRALAVTSLQRSAVAPEVPTVAENGFPGFEALAWHGILAPAKTPPAIVKKLNAEIVNALKHPETQALLVKQAMQTVGNTPEEFAAFIRNDIAVWKAVAAEADVSVK